MSKFSKYLLVIVTILFIVSTGLAIFFHFINTEYRKERKALVSYIAQIDSSARKLEKMVNWSVYYTNMARAAWGINAGSCDVALIKKIENIIKDTGADSVGVDVPLVLSVIVVESGFNRNIVSSAGAIGIMQVMHSTAAMHIPNVSKEDLYDENVNLKAGILELKRLLIAFNRDKELALLAYNRGERRVKSLLSQNLSPRNRYSERVLSIYFVN